MVVVSARDEIYIHAKGKAIENNITVPLAD